MLKSVQKPIPSATSNLLLMQVYKSLAPVSTGARCRFDMYVRIRPGIPSPFKDQKRSWCYRGDKYTNEPNRMLKNLLKLADKRIADYDRLIIYDHDNGDTEKEILRIIDGVVSVNLLHRYKLLLFDFKLPEYLNS